MKDSHRDMAQKVITWRAKAEGIGRDKEWREKLGYSYVRRLAASVLFCFPTRTLQAETIESVVKLVKEHDDAIDFVERQG